VIATDVSSDRFKSMSVSLRFPIVGEGGPNGLIMVDGNLVLGERWVRFAKSPYDDWLAENPAQIANGFVS